MQYIKDLKADERVIEHYLCKQRQVLKTKTGKNYLSLKLQDKTGVVDAKVWELHNDIGDFAENDVIKIDGVALTYANDLQIKISRIRKSAEGEYDEADFLPSTKKDIEALYTQLMGYVDSIRQPQLKLMLEKILLEDTRIAGSIKTHSAAKTMHHAYLGGLLEHIVSVVEICDFMSGRHETVDRDILIASAILHDIAKVYELTPMPMNAYTDDGQMLGHIYMGAELVGRACAEIPGFPPQLEALIKHAILAHHGEYEFGSPKLPATLEAFLLHSADNMDAKMKVYEDAMESGAAQGPWVGYHKLLERYLRKSTYDENEKA